ncbi:6-pyruvoyl trahydropterin synthase family protein [Nostoc sp.]|uniref:6-pyruvoyl trahydropterin synthase family protein n=1 Tax=Nostoc sp. TaxID=1180 RepID=UPI002FF45758
MPKWKLVTEFTFDSAHYIKDYDGPCGKMHGHSYKVRIEATSSKLHSSQYCPHPVMVADFKTLRWAKQDVTKGGLDHCVLNEVLPPEYETTAEMIAKYIYDLTLPAINRRGFLVQRNHKTSDSLRRLNQRWDSP